MNGVLLLVGIGSGLAHSVYSVISKALLKHRLDEPLVLLLYINVIQAIVSPAIWLVVEPVWPSADGWWPVLMSGATCVVAYVFLYLAVSHGDVSSVMPIMGSKVILSGLMAVWMLGESHGWSVYLAAVLVTVSIAMLTYSPSPVHSARFPLKPIVLMIACCMVFAVTDMYIKRSLAYMNACNFLVYYNIIIGLLSLGVIPYVRTRGASVALTRGDLLLATYSSLSLVAATLLFVLAFELADGVVVPNILMSTRGVFTVLITAVLTHIGSSAADTQSKKVYLLRLVASSLIVLSIWLALSK